MPKVTPESFDMMYEDEFEFMCGDLTADLINPTEEQLEPLRDAIIQELRANKDAKKPYKREDVAVLAPQAWVDALEVIDDIIFSKYKPRQKRRLEVNMTERQLEMLVIFAVKCIDPRVIVKVLNENEDAVGN